MVGSAEMTLNGIHQARRNYRADYHELRATLIYDMVYYHTLSGQNMLCDHGQAYAHNSLQLMNGKENE